MSANVFLKKLRLRNFRSVRDTEITFDNPLFLVGRNGSGKSNVVDAIAFLSDCMNLPLDLAVKKRRYINFHNTTNSEAFVELQADFDSSVAGAHNTGSYLLRLKWEKGEFFVDCEECIVGNSETTPFFKRGRSSFESSITGLNPRLGSQNLVLPLVGGFGEFAGLANGLASMRVYSIDHRKIRQEEKVEASSILSANGDNVAGVIKYLSETNNAHIMDGVATIVNSITPVKTRFDALKFKDGTATLYGTENIFDEDFGGGVTSMSTPDIFSDGTLHTLGLAVALQQDPLPSVLVIEEPENNLHPGALNAIADLIEEASGKTQVIITTHSPDLLDTKWIKPENLRVVVWENNSSRVAELGERPKAALQKHLWYAGQLMRANALEAAPAELAEQTADKEPVTAGS